MKKQKNKSKKKQVAIFDIDGTIFRSSLLIEFNKGLVRTGVIPEATLTPILKAYYAWVERRGSYTTYIRSVIRMHARSIRGKEQRYVQAAADLVFLRHRDRVYRYTRDLLQTLKPTHRLLAISGSPIEIVEPFATYFGFDEVWGSVYAIDRKGLYTGKQLDQRSIANKDIILKNYLRAHRLSLRGSVGVGDTETDISVLKLVERPIVFNPSNKLFRVAKREHWPVVVERKDVVYHIKT